MIVEEVQPTKPSMAPMNCNNGATATVGCVTVLSISFAALSYFLFNQQRTSERRKSKKNKPICSQRHGNGVVAAIGNTPLIRINSLSEATGCEVLSVYNSFDLILFIRVF